MFIHSVFSNKKNLPPSFLTGQGGKNQVGLGTSSYSSSRNNLNKGLDTSKKGRAAKDVKPSCVRLTVTARRGISDATWSCGLPGALAVTSGKQVAQGSLCQSEGHSMPWLCQAELT